MGQVLNLSPYFELNIAKYAKERSIDFNEAGLELLERSIYFYGLSDSVKRKSPNFTVGAMLLFVETSPWCKGANVTVRDLFSALHGGNWDDLTQERQEYIVSSLIEETRSPYWKLTCLREMGVHSTFGW